LYGHIDGTSPAPPQYIDREVKRTVVADQGGGASAGSEIRFEYETVTENNPAYEVWLAHDQSLVAYITSTLSEEVLGGVDDDLTALELWSTLATTYSQVSEAHFLQLRRQFQDIKRGMRTVLEYLNEIKSVSDQLAAIGHPVSDKDKVQQALSGLGTEFDIFCTALEVLPVLPSAELDSLQQPQCIDYRDSCNARASYPSLDPSGRNGKKYSSNPPRLQDPKATLMTLNDKNETYDTWLHAEILRQGAEMLPKQKEQAANEPETVVNTSLDNTASLENMSSSPQQNDPPRDNRFSGLETIYHLQVSHDVSESQSQDWKKVKTPLLLMKLFG
ncbi:hypothetical protein EJ110_NYTH58879, partial [Nymphaea thermarum]